jgi:hypothetical protein
LAILHNERPDSVEAVEQRFKQALENINEIEKVSLYFH